MGLNLKAVDTCLCMGASISQAAGLYQSFKQAGGKVPPIVATIGDSTFFHAGIPALINAVHQGACLILLILDNGIVAMTGGQPTPTWDGPGKRMEIEKVAKGCGVDFIRVVDPYDIPLLIQLLREADQYARGKGKGVAVIITRHPCLIYGVRDERREEGEIIIGEECDSCGVYTKSFECPALQKDPEGKPVIVKALCANCGVCLYVCPQGVIERR